NHDDRVETAYVYEVSAAGGQRPNQCRRGSRLVVSEQQNGRWITTATLGGRKLLLGLGRLLTAAAAADRDWYAWLHGTRGTAAGADQAAPAGRQGLQQAA